MTLARIRYIQRQLSKKYGIIGRVASRYLEAGLSVRVNHPTRLGPAHVFAQGNGQRLLIEVHYSSKPLKPEDVNRVVEKARLLRAKPIIVVYGKGRKKLVSGEALAEAAKQQVKIRMVENTH